MFGLGSNPVSYTHLDVYKRQVFKLNPELNTVSDVVTEWFEPNPNMQNQCIHLLNKSKDKSWRKKQIPGLYKDRKIIVEFYVYLINTENFEREKAIKICEVVRKKQPLTSLARLLRDWKKDHSNTFKGLSDQVFLFI